jgi:hypothetical protein
MTNNLLFVPDGLTKEDDTPSQLADTCNQTYLKYMLDLLFACSSVTIFNGTSSSSYLYFLATYLPYY